MRAEEHVVRKCWFFVAVALLLLIQIIQASAAYSTDDLLVKQSKLVQKWGVSNVDAITKKTWWNPFDPDRVEGLTRLLDVAPENKVTALTTKRAAMLIGDKKLTAALKEFKGVEGFEKVGQRLIDSEPKSPMFEAKKALELKEKGKTIQKFEEFIETSKGNTDLDITYVDGGVTKYLETSAYNWNKASGEAIKDIRLKLEKYIRHAGDASKVKFASEQGVTPAVKQLLDDLSIELI